MIIKLEPGFHNKNKLFRICAKLKSFYPQHIKDYKNIPVIINNFNRLECLKLQINWLESAGMTNIYIIDNASTYPPLLEYYKTSKYLVFQLTKNVGHLAFWDTHVQQWFKNQYYILTDPDIIPVEECPLDVVSYFLEILENRPSITKVGFGLKIDDIPDFYPRKQEVIEWEKEFWNEPLGNDLYKAKIDTTFALYKPNTRYQQWETTLRTGGNFIARHLPWYENPEKISEEELFFKKVTTAVSSWYKDETYNG